MIRDILISDLVELEKHALFPLQNLRTKPKVLEKSFVDDKGLLGSAILNSTTELSVVLNDRPLRDKIKVLREIENLVYKTLKEKGYRDIHLFVNDPTFANILVQHFNFQYCNGRALVRLI